MSSLQATIVAVARKLNMVAQDGELVRLDSIMIIDFVLALEQATAIRIPNSVLNPEHFDSYTSIESMLLACQAA